MGRKGWRSAHLPPVWPGFRSRLRRPMWVEFVCFLLCSKRFFCRYSSFPLSSKTNIFKSNSTRNQVDKEPLCGCATSKSLFIYVFIIQNLTVTHQNWKKLIVNRQSFHPIKTLCSGRHSRDVLVEVCRRGTPSNHDPFCNPV